MTADAPDRLCIIIVPDGDGDRLVDVLQDAGYAATRIASSGGLLRRGSTTVLAAVTDEHVGDIARLLHQHFPVASDSVPAHAFPWWNEAEGRDEQIEVRVGGAVMFVVQVSQFLRI